MDGVESAGKEAVKAELAKPKPDRLLVIAQAYRHGLTTAEIHAACHFEPWFLERIGEIVETEERVRRDGLPSERSGLLRLKQMGFADARLGRLAGQDEEAVSARRRELDLHPVYKRIDTCAAEFPSLTSYMYSTYEGDGFDDARMRVRSERTRKVVILGGGPNRIGQGIEFDYCCVHAAYSLKEAGIETIMVNCNPGDRLDRLRHLRPAVFRAVDRRGRDRARAGRGAATAKCSASSCSSAAKRR